MLYSQSLVLVLLMATLSPARLCAVGGRRLTDSVRACPLTRSHKLVLDENVFLVEHWLSLSSAFDVPAGRTDNVHGALESEWSTSRN